MPENITEPTCEITQVHMCTQTKWGSVSEWLGQILPKEGSKAFGKLVV